MIWHRFVCLVLGHKPAQQVIAQDVRVPPVGNRVIVTRLECPRCGEPR